MYCRCHVYLHTSRVSVVLCWFCSSWGTRLAFQERLEGRRRLLIVSWLCIVTDYWRNRSCACESYITQNSKVYLLWNDTLWQHVRGDECIMELNCKFREACYFVILAQFKKKSWKCFCQIVYDFQKRMSKKVNLSWKLYAFNNYFFFFYISTFLVSLLVEHHCFKMSCCVVEVKKKKVTTLTF